MYKATNKYLQSQSRFNTSDKIIILVLLFFVPIPPYVLVEKPGKEITIIQIQSLALNVRVL